jgi:acyl-coenzyme A thioesterase PaaI-like protein
MKAERKKIRNPFISLEGYNCFGCAPSNPVGLHLDFYEDGEFITAEWLPGINFQGYFNILHGGIQAALMDEIASWTMYVKIQTAGYTSGAEIRYLKRVSILEGPITLRARILQMRRNLADIEVELIDKEQNVCSRALFTYFTFSIEKSRKFMFYPDPQDFYEKI